jgi:hypothetical protein
MVGRWKNCNNELKYTICHMGHNKYGVEFIYVNCYMGGVGSNPRPTRFKPFIVTTLQYYSCPPVISKLSVAHWYIVRYSMVLGAEVAGSSLSTSTIWSIVIILHHI